MKKGSQTKQAILLHAKTIFAQHGFTSITMQDICDVTKLSRGGLYRHYDNTAHIMHDVLSLLCDAQTDFVVEQIKQSVPAKKIAEALFHQYQKELCDDTPSLTLAIFEYNAAHHDPIMTILYQKAKQRWIDLITYGCETHAFHPIDQDAWIDALLFSYQGAMMWKQIIPARPQSSQFLTLLKEALFL